MVVFRLTGIIEAPMAQDLLSAWSGLRSKYGHVLFDLDSPGGSMEETEKILAGIADIRPVAQVDTLVQRGAKCASACVAIFVQGHDRAAAGASIWMFHGVCRAWSNEPSPSETGRFLDILRRAGVSETFLCHLVDEGYVTSPGKLWISGYELFHVYQSNVITRLLDPWRPEPPLPPARSGR